MPGEIKFTIGGQEFKFTEGVKVKKDVIKELGKLGFGSLWNEIDDGDRKLDKKEWGRLEKLAQYINNLADKSKTAITAAMGALTKEYEADGQQFNFVTFLGNKVTAQNKAKEEAAAAEQQAIANKGTAESYSDFDAALKNAKETEGFDEKAFVEKFLSDKLEYAKKFSDFQTKYDEAKKTQGDKFVEKDFVLEFIKSKLDEAKKLDGYDAAFAEAEKAEGFDMYKFIQEFIAQKEAASKAAAEQETLPVDPKAQLVASYSHNHKVSNGETLGLIAKKLLVVAGNPNPTKQEILAKVKEIAEINGIKNINLIYEGQSIKLPAEVGNVSRTTRVSGSSGGSGRTGSTGGTGGTGRTGGAGGAEGAVGADGAKKQAEAIGTIVVNKTQAQVETAGRGNATSICDAVFKTKTKDAIINQLKLVSPEKAAYIIEQFYLNSKNYNSDNYKDIVSALEGTLTKNEILIHIVNPLRKRADALGIQYTNVDSNSSIDDIKKLVTDLTSAIIAKDKASFISQEELYYQEAIGSFKKGNIESFELIDDKKISIKLKDGNIMLVVFDTYGAVEKCMINIDNYTNHSGGNIYDVSFSKNNVEIDAAGDDSKRGVVAMPNYSFAAVNNAVVNLIDTRRALSLLKEIKDLEAQYKAAGKQYTQSELKEIKADLKAQIDLKKQELQACIKN